MGRCKIVVYNEGNRKEFSTGTKRMEDAVRDLTDYVETKYYGNGKGGSR